MCSLLLALQVVLKILHTAAAEGPPLNGPHPMGTKDCGETTATPTMLLAPELVNLLRGELACCLIQLTRQYGYPSVVMQMLLDIFSSMYAVLGPVSKGLVECFVKFVYLRALQEALALLRDDGNILVRGIAPASGNSSQPASIGQVQTQVRLMEEEHTHAPFSEEQICAVLESLHDLLANAGFLTTLFASFDCDCAREDLVQPLLHLMGQCEWYSSMNTYKAPVERVRYVHLDLINKKNVLFCYNFSSFLFK